MAEEQVAAKGDAGKKIGRGVSYPVIGLEDAIEKARTFHREERKSAAPVASAIKHFGYSESSSGGRQTVATLIQFGLLEDEGRSENRHVRLTDRALTILLDEPASPTRLLALRECATMPKLYSLILAKYGTELPSDHSLGFYLQKEFDFNPKTLKSFIKDFRGTLAFAGVLDAPNIPFTEPKKPTQNEGLSGAGAVSVDVGDLIQWESSGLLRLEAPRRVRGKTEHEGSWWVFVEGSETGIPMEEVSVIERKATDPVVPKQLPPSMPLQPITVGTVPLQPAPLVGEQQVASGKFGKSMSYRLLATGEIGAKELGKIIKLLEAYKLALEDEDEDEEL
ncbi:MAG: hypothetical protein A2710_24470 [Burkholderiales bacterium RIFCSPHIGHO2_01_FULL_64_960]|nr:MAG: hypothetical protein A2710_24470 [Burkholderiales bacterium RIFCSPHIGHO2_01_FULL_64_960]